MESIILTLDNGEKKEYVKGIKLKEVLENLKKQYSNEVIFARYNGKILDEEDKISKTGKLSLYDLNTMQGNKAYERGLLYLFEHCAHEVLGQDTAIYVKYSIDKGIFCKIDSPITQEDVTKIKKIMKEKVKEELPFVKVETTKEEATAYFKSLKREDKCNFFSY